MSGYGTLWSELNFNSNFIPFFQNKMALFFPIIGESIINLVLTQTRLLFALKFVKGGLHVSFLGLTKINYCRSYIYNTSKNIFPCRRQRHMTKKVRHYSNSRHLQ